MLTDISGRKGRKDAFLELILYILEKKKKKKTSTKFLTGPNKKFLVGKSNTE